MPLFTIAFTFISWNICIKLLNISAYSDGEINNVFSSLLSTEFYNKLPSFINVLIELIKEYKVLLLLVFALVISAFMSDFKNMKKNIFKKIILFMVYCLSNIAYIIFLYSVCNTMITIDIATEALRRYLLTLLAANLLIICVGLISCGIKNKNIYCSIIILMLLYSTTPAYWQITKLFNRDYTNESIEYREKYSTINEKIRAANISNKDVIYYIKEIEGDIYLSNFSVFPIQLSHMPQWSAELDINSYSEILLNKNNIALFATHNDKEKNKLEEKKEGNIYIYIYKVTDENYSYYGNLFEYNQIQMLDETLYLVEDVNNIAKLSIIE